MKQLDLFADSEIWSDINGYEGMYQVSNKGRIRGLDRIIVQRDGKKQNIRGKIIAIGIKNNGYYMGQICSNGKMVNFTVHRLMALAFIPKVDGKDFVNHIDGNRANNDINNLEWVSRSENCRHGFERAIKENRKYNNQQRFTKEDIIKIRTMQKSKITMVQIAKEFNTKSGTIGDIVHRKIWDYEGT